MLKWLWLSFAVIVADQISKIAVSNWLDLYESVPVVPFVNLRLAHNSGAAFSILAGAGGWQRWFFLILALTVSTVLIVWLSRLTATAKSEAIALTLIIGGAIGNAMDRLFYGHVIDFIDLYMNSYHWPAFNVADSAICVGALLLIIDSFRKPADKQ